MSDDRTAIHETHTQGTGQSDPAHPIGRSDGPRPPRPLLVGLVLAVIVLGAALTIYFSTMDPTQDDIRSDPAGDPPVSAEEGSG